MIEQQDSGVCIRIILTEHMIVGMVGISNKVFVYLGVGSGPRVIDVG